MLAASSRVARRARRSACRAACGSAPTTGGPTGAACGPPPRPMAPRAGASAPSRRVALKRIGNFERRSTSPARPASRSCLFVVEQPGKIVVLATASRPAEPFLDISGQVDSRRRAWPALDRLPAGLRASGASTSTTPIAAGNIRIDEFQRATPTRADPAPQRASDRDPPPGQRQPQRRPAAVLRRRPLLRHRRRRLRRRPAEQRPEQGNAAGQAAAHRPARRGRQALHGARRQPLRRQARARRDLHLRPAQPLPLLLRHDQREAAADRDRRRRPEPLRGARLHDPCRRRGANFGWDALEGFTPYEEENSGTPTPAAPTKPIFAYSHDRDGSCSIIGGYVVRDPLAPRLCGPLPLRRLLRGRAAQPRPPPGVAPAATASPASTVASPTSFGEDDPGHIYVASQEGPVYRLVAEAPLRDADLNSPSPRRRRLQPRPPSSSVLRRRPEAPRPAHAGCRG